MSMLSPYQVLDLTDERGELGPMLLGDLGADVIRVEPPEGTTARRVAPLLPGVAQDMASLQFYAFNRNKRSIALDPASAPDIELLRTLILRTDFLFDSYPDALTERFGLSVDDVLALNPRIVMVRVSAFGSTGPHADLVANDLVVAAMGGPMSLQGTPDRAPIRVSVRGLGAVSSSASMAVATSVKGTG